MAKQKNMAHRKAYRRQSASDLKAKRATRTDEQQLAHLDKILGVNKGATKERARLKKNINKQKNTTTKKENKNGNA